MSPSVQAPELRRTPASASEVPVHHRPPYGWAALAGVVVFALYALTLGPSTFWWDTSEYIATGHILGVPHPPGNPLFVLLARAWDILLAPMGLSTAVRINLFSAFMSAGSAALWFLLVHRILAYFTASETVRRVGAGAAVLVSATAYTVWSQSVVNEKVYTVSLLTIAVLSWLAFLWRDHVEEHRGETGSRWHDDNVLVLMAFVLALSSEGNHRMAFLAAPALFVLVAWTKPRAAVSLLLGFLGLLTISTFLSESYGLAILLALVVGGVAAGLPRWVDLRLAGASLGAAIVGMSVQLFLPIRAALNPIINEAAPACPGGLGSALRAIYSFGGAGCEALAASLSREQYAKPPVTERLAPFSDQLANYFQYFDWQWARTLQDADTYFAPGRLPITLLFLGLGIWGAWEHYKRDRKSFAYVAILFATLSFGLVFYMNFKYGFGQVMERGLAMDLAEVRERDYFFLISFSIWGLWAGVGITALWMDVMEMVRGPRKALVASPVLALAFIPLALNYSYADRAGDYSARDWAYNLLQSVEPYGVVFTNGDNDTFPLWYLQEVEGIRRDVTVIVRSYLNTPWYARQIRELTQPCPTPDAWRADPTRIICQRDFDPAVAPDFYGTPPKPTGTALPVTDRDIDLVTSPSGYMVLPQDVMYEARGIEATIPRGTFVQPADQLAITMIQQAWGDRPIYFAATTNMHRDLGLGGHVARQGVAYKLLTPQEAEGMLAMPRDHPYAPILGGYFDVERNRKLLQETFIYRDLLDKPYWTEPSTRSIPTYYAYALVAQSVAEEMLGNTQRAEELIQTAERWMELAER